jgi:hypothetical protein
MHSHQNTQQVPHFIRDALQQLLAVGYAYYLALVILATNQGAVLGIGEATEPLEVLIPPRLLPCNVLIFGADRGLINEDRLKRKGAKVNRYAR